MNTVVVDAGPAAVGVGSGVSPGSGVGTGAVTGGSGVKAAAVPEPAG